ncbi:MAG: mechanosensitive ion channel family protein [Omnitrophica WOR_2 bacterium]
MGPIPTTLDKLLASFLLVLPNIIVSLVIFFVGLFLANTITRLVRGMMDRRNSAREATALITRLIYWGFTSLVIIAALENIGFNLTAFLAGLGIVGIVIGFALQDISKNFVSGLILLSMRPFNVGDMLGVTSYQGTVLAIETRSTKLLTLDGRIVLIPNADLMTNAIINYSQNTRRRVQIDLTLPNPGDSESVRQAATRAILSIHGLIQGTTSEGVINRMDASSLTMSIYYWIDTAETTVAEAQDAGIRAVKDTLAGAEVKAI